MVFTSISVIPSTCCHRLCCAALSGDSISHYQWADGATPAPGNLPSDYIAADWPPATPPRCLVVNTWNGFDQGLMSERCGYSFFFSCKVNLPNPVYSQEVDGLVIESFPFLLNFNQSQEVSGTATPTCCIAWC
jgi:hypothetical protein